MRVSRQPSSNQTRRVPTSILLEAAFAGGAQSAKSKCGRRPMAATRSETMRIAPLLIFITDVHALGLEMAQGLSCTTSFYWNYNDRTRAFTERVLPHMANHAYPNMANAGCYSITMHYLKAAAAMGAVEAKKSGRDTVARMKGIPTDDDAFGQGRVRADGRGEFPAYLWRVKKPSESKAPWDLFDLISITPPAQALHPLNPKCKFSVVGPA